MQNKVIKEQFSPDQIQNLASDPMQNVYVSASAGTGKTKILTDRFIRFAQSGVPIENILCLTFTNAAAHEMKHRIATRLKALDDGLYEHFVHNYDKLQIKTIHSLCNDILAKTDIAFSSKKLLDYNLKSKAILRIIHDVYTELYDSSPYVIEHLAKYFDEYDIYKKLSAVLSKKINLLSIDDVEGYYRNLFNVKAVALAEVTQQIFDEIPSSLFEHFEKFSEFRDLENIHANLDAERYLLCFYTTKGQLRKVFEKKSPSFAKLFETEAKRVEDLLDLYRTEDNCLTHIYLITFFQLCIKRFNTFKVENNFYEFDDLITQTLSLLSESATALNILYNLDMKIDHVLVDEAQDLSPLQWELIKIITDEFFAGDSARELNRTIFIVGDFKQSIYSFQGANPTSFLEAKTYFAQKLHACGKELVEVEMHHSFRAAQNILKATDIVFNAPERNFAVTGQQDAKIYHYATRAQLGNVEVLELAENPKNIENDGWDIPTEQLNYYNPKQQTAIQIADMVKGWVDMGFEQSDTLILIRKRSELVNFLVKELKHRGLQVSDASQNFLSDELMVRDFASVAKFILFPYDDFNTACLLKSPFHDVSENDLFTLCHDRTERLYKKVELEFGFDGDVKTFYVRLLEKYKANFIKRFGQRAVNVINDFLSYLLAKDGGFTLLDLINEVENYSISKADNKKLVPGKVNILTVHAAKGLQAKKVILADSASTEQQPIQDILVYGGHVFFNLYSQYNSKFINSIKEKLIDYSALENMRLLYVAMTRAEDELYITGWENSRINGSWYEVVRDSISGLSLTSPSICSAPAAKHVLKEPVPEFITKPFTTVVDRMIFTPSESFHSNAAAIKRGGYIHKLLMKLANNSDVGPILSQITDPEILEKVKLIIAKHPLLFSANCLNEVPVAGIIDGKYVFGQIDKLVIHNNAVEIIDIKTDELPPLSPDKINHSYIRQLNLYHQLISKIYPDRKISCWILWFSNQELMRVGK